MQLMRSRMLLIGACVAVCGVAGCSREPQATRASASDIDCLARAMYFETNRSSRDGMVAVGSVVMNRVQSDAFPDNVCAVVGQRNQFAPGVMTKAMDGQGRALAEISATAVLAGERHPHVASAKFFHAAWYDANYNNIHYVVTAGGNAFYEKRRPENVTTPDPLPQTEGVTG
ncbi:cell wall hydrolase [Loktanella sp. D2R18]|nr:MULTISPECIES: cell wall hydrolase [Rhodobacterales]MDO6589383.1 cell wall hydrolase [Yoonia sp. 1_MG-2023]RBW45542.1 cell wall hydrolase [Loktanella sp. D2R18]